MLAIDQLRCTGCGACVQKCPRHCISFAAGELGHRLPVIDSTACIGCGLCEKVCPIDKKHSQPQQQKFYGAVHQEEAVRMDSTSGGFFTAIAQEIFSRNGVIYGCAFEEHFQARHIRIESMEELPELRGSKYLQSDMGTCFCQAEADLKAGRTVLFTGTPCQIAGLECFLGKKYDQLVTVDLICHGVGSQKFFDRYLSWWEQRRGNLSSLSFRDKHTCGWSCGGSYSIASGSLHPYYDYNNYYYHYFLHGDIYRDSCYTCPYASVLRPGDFTMGDFWGVEKYGLPLNTVQGCSLVIVNTPKAEKLFAALQNRLVTAEVTREQAERANGQLVHPAAHSALRAELVRQYAALSPEEMDRAFRRICRKDILKLHIKAMIPYSLKRSLRKILR